MSSKYIDDHVIFCFWTGTNEMSQNRKNCLEDFKLKSNCKVILVTPDNLKDYIVEPLHEAYKYLSYTHRCDYLRTYFMHFHGGGYSDIKRTTGDWNKAFEDIKNSENILINGYHERNIGCIAGPEHIRKEWQRLIGNGSYIVKPRTNLTSEWFKKLNQTLDIKLPLLMSNPLKDHAIRHNSNPTYPIFWTEILGTIFHPLLCNYLDNIEYTVPRPICQNYL